MTTPFIHLNSKTHSNGWLDMLQCGSEYLILNFYVLFILKFLNKNNSKLSFSFWFLASFLRYFSFFDMQITHDVVYGE